MSEESKEQKSPGGGGNENIWLTIYSDLMTNLMLFFLMLYGITRLSVDVRQNILQEIASQFKKPSERKALIDAYEKTAGDFSEAVMKIKENPAVSEVLVEAGAYRIILKAPVVFPKASASLKKESVEVLQKLCELFRTSPWKIEIAGHTDNIPVKGKYKDNFELSLARAESVRKFFVSKGVPPEKICVAGYGEMRPAWPNDSEENRMKNRRIEIFVR